MNKPNRLTERLAEESGGDLGRALVISDEESDRVMANLN